MTLTESLEIDGELIVDYVRELQRVGDSEKAIHWLKKIQEMSRAMLWYVRKAAPTEGEKDG